MTIYDIVESNKRKTILFLILTPLLTSALFVLFFTIARLMAQDMGVAYVYKDYINNLPQGLMKVIISNPKLYLPLSLISITIANIMWVIFKFKSSAEFTIKHLDVEEITYYNYPNIYNTIQNIATTASITTPTAYILNSEQMNAFAAGSDPDKSVVVLTKGLIELLNKDELEGVVGHEIAHIKNQDTRLMMALIYSGAMYGLIAEFLLNLLRIPGRMYRDSNRDDSKGKNGSLLLSSIVFILPMIIFSYIIYYIVSPITRLAVSRKREFLADSTSVLLTRNPDALVEALIKINDNSYVKELDSIKYSALCIANPSRSFFTKLMSTHPPIHERIKVILEAFE